MSDRWASFDCYGTLIDWDAGVRACLASVWPGTDADRLLRRYHEIEPALQVDGARSYREVLDAALVGVAEAERLSLPPSLSGALSGSLASWPPFPDAPGSLRVLRDRGWRVAVLSNTDPDLLAVSLSLVGVEVHVTVAASEIGSYKPAFSHWETFFERTGADRARHVHVAASLFHDVQPCAALGLPCVWINRRGETSDLPRAGELPGLRDLPDLVDALVAVD